MTSLATNTGLCVRVVESTPASNVARCVSVSIGGVAARLARELIACWPVLFANASTHRARPAGVSWVNKFHRHSDKPAFVGNLRLKVGECPRVQDAALLFSSPNPRSDVRQILQRNTTLRAFSNTDNLFRDNVVRVPHKSLLAPAQSAQHTLRGAGAFGLKPFALSPATGTNTGNLASVSECLTVGALGQINEPKVDAKPPYGRLLHLLRNFNRHIQIPFSVAKNQIRLAFWKLKQLALPLSAEEWKIFNPSANRPDAHGGLGKLEIKNAGVVGNAAELAKLALFFPVQFVSVGNLGNQTRNNLRGQWEFTTKLFVKQAVHWELSKFFLLPRKLRKPVCTTVGSLKRFTQCFGLFRSWIQLDLNGQFQHCIFGSNI